MSMDKLKRIKTLNFPCLNRSLSVYYDNRMLTALAPAGRLVLSDLSRAKTRGAEGPAAFSE